MGNRRHVIRFEVAAMNYQHVVAGGSELFDDCPTDESRSA
jgi:hypothetical protein